MYNGMAKVNSVAVLQPGIIDMEIAAPEAAMVAQAGQFVNVYLNDKSRLLPRPISICRINRNNGTLRLVFRIAGEGTKQMAAFKPGDEIKIMGPLGNGFIDTDIKNAVLFGGGIGIPPMLGLAEKLHSEGIKVTSVLGYRDKNTFLDEEFEKYGDVVIATDDGSSGFHGNVVQAAESLGILKDKASGETCIFACGPGPMLKGVKAAGEKNGVPAQISMEERMACGVGACLGCVVKTTEVDEHSQVKNKRVCKDGPVFWANEIEL